MSEFALQQLSEQVRAASAAATPLCIRGGGSKDWYGQTPQGTLLDTRSYSGVIAYEPTELVVTARCGTPLADIEALLTQHRQMLAFEPPRFNSSATIGGVVAAGLSGPRRQAAGAVRDFVLGAALLDGQGELLHFGGQVMKNVAGYDVSRLLAGSLGTLGVIAEVSLKVLPMPVAERSVQLEMPQADAIRALNQWGARPLPISASAWHDGVLRVRLSGAQAAVDAARRQLGGEDLAQPESFWNSLREQQSMYFLAEQTRVIWRLSLPSVAEPIDLPGEQLIEWGGAQRWLKIDVDAQASIAGKAAGGAAAGAAAIRQRAAQLGGHATLFRGGDKTVGVFHPLAPALAAIHRRLKAGFDPAGIFNRGRMYAEW